MSTSLRATIAAQTERSAVLGAQTAFLRANSDAYEWLVKQVRYLSKHSDAERVLRGVVSAARFAATFHPGRFADGAIENLALDIGVELGGLISDGGVPVPVGRGERGRQVLHVASQVMAVGGHTRTLHHWMSSDRSSCHSLVVVNQQGVPIPRWLSEAVRDSAGDLTVFPGGSDLRQKAAWLREGATRGADLVVLHHDPFDVVPTVAFARPGGPPVALLNHADHLFWLGGSVSDLVINLRTAGAEHAADRRFAGVNAVFPVPLAEPVQQISRRDARRALGIPETQIALLSVGRAEKYRPCGPYDFVSTAGRILERRPEAHIYVVGESLAGITPHVRGNVHERLHFMGSVDDPSMHRAAADVYLETFPFGSQTALLEAALSSLPVVPAYAPLFPLLVANDDALQELITNPHDEQEYVERVDALIRDADRRLALGDKLRQCLLVDHVGEGWLARLADVYRQTDRMTHHPKRMPSSPCRTTDADIGLSMWHVVGDGRTYTAVKPDDGGDQLLCHSAFVTKEVGNYASARRLAWRAVRHNPRWLASWRLLAVTVLGRAGRLIGRIRQLFRQRRAARKDVAR